MTDAFAQLDLEIIRANGTVDSYIVRLMAPVPTDQHWHCGVQLESATAKVIQIYGVDSWQALTLAIEFVRVNLETSIKKGNKFLRFGKPVEINTLFPQSYSA